MTASDKGPPRPTILPDMADTDIPVTRVITATDRLREAALKGRFLKGPIPLEWVRENVLDPAGRLMLVLVAYADMKNDRSFKLTDGMIRDANLQSRKQVYRALAKLERAGVLAVGRLAGQKPFITIRRMPDRSVAARTRHE